MDDEPTLVMRRHPTSNPIDATLLSAPLPPPSPLRPLVLPQHQHRRTVRPPMSLMIDTPAPPPPARRREWLTEQHLYLSAVVLAIVGVVFRVVQP